MSPHRAALLLALSACAHAQIAGQILDRNAAPVPRASVTLSPGDISIVTDEEGRFIIDYLREGEEARKVPVRPNRDYSIEVYKPGFNVHRETFYFKRGQLELTTIDLVEDTIEVRDDELQLDVGLYGNPTQSAGANYEGQ